MPRDPDEHVEAVVQQVVEDLLAQDALRDAALPHLVRVHDPRTGGDDHYGPFAAATEALAAAELLAGAFAADPDTADVQVTVHPLRPPAPPLLGA